MQDTQGRQEQRPFQTELISLPTQSPLPVPMSTLPARPQSSKTLGEVVEPEQAAEYARQGAPVEQRAQRIVVFPGAQMEHRRPADASASRSPQRRPETGVMSAPLSAGLATSLTGQFFPGPVGERKGHSGVQHRKQKHHAMHKMHRHSMEQTHEDPASAAAAAVQGEFPQAPGALRRVAQTGDTGAEALLAFASQRT